MLSQKMQDALNDQINAEIDSAYLYLAMSAWSEANNLKGFAKWFQVQWQEELQHAMKFFAYVTDRRGTVQLKAVPAPTASWPAALAVFEATLAHEQLVTARINKLVDLAQSEGDHATRNFLQWFVSEQVEEEAAADEIVQQLKMIGPSTGSLFYIDRHLGKRGGS